MISDTEMTAEPQFQLSLSMQSGSESPLSQHGGKKKHNSPFHTSFQDGGGISPSPLGMFNSFSPLNGGKFCDQQVNDSPR